jgi:hypothetical protein
MRVAITIDPRDPHRDWVRDDAEWWLGNHARDRWRFREQEDLRGRVVLTFEFDNPLDAMDFNVLRCAMPEHLGRLL